MTRRKMPKKNAKPPLTAWPDRARRYTAARHFASRASQPLVAAFLTEQRLKGAPIKLTPKEWEQHYQEFLTAPR